MSARNALRENAHKRICPGGGETKRRKNFNFYRYSTYCMGGVVPHAHRPPTTTCDRQNNAASACLFHVQMRSSAKRRNPAYAPLHDLP